MNDLQFRSLDRWPRERTKHPIRSRFSENYSRTLELLDRELRHLGARDVIILADCSAADLRRDGTLAAGASLRSQGIILCFVGKHGLVRMPCDRYNDWRDNIRAIAVSLEALRAVDRHGVTSSGEQYRGWTALPSSIEMPAAEFESLEEAARVLLRLGGSGVHAANVNAVLRDGGLDLAYRAAAKVAHPDTGGSNDLMAKVNRAREFLVAGGCR